MSKRKILTTIIIPALLISGLIIILVNNQREFPGELVFSETRLDFGTVPEWKGQVTRKVLARNIGKSPLQINRIQTGCSYAEIEGPKVIPPDTEGTFQVTLNPQILPADTTSATAILFTDSPNTPQVYLTIVAKAKPFAILSTEVCDFGEILPETPQKKRIKLCVNALLNQEEIHILPPEHPILTWDIVPDPSSQCLFITIQLQIPKRDRVVNTKDRLYNVGKPFAALLTVVFPNDRTLTLPIVAKIIEPVMAEPDSLSYGTVANGEITPSLKFTLSAKTEFKVLNIQASDHLKVMEIHSPMLSNAHSTHYEKQFQVSWNVSKSSILLREDIRIITSATSSPIRIPVYGYIRADQSNTLSLPQERE